MFIALLLATQVAFASAAFKHMEKAITSIRDDFKIADRAPQNAQHEVVFAVQQLNLDKIENLLYEVSDPKNPKYGAHLSRAEVANMTANPTASNFIKTYLENNNAVAVKVSPFGEYITATATIAVWEKLFDTKFFAFEHVDRAIPVVYRALHYYVEEELAPHVSAVFNTVQLPPRISPKKAMKLKAEGGSGSVTPAFLNSYYDITSNTGNSKASQSVYESLGQYYSPNDLTQFEKSYDVPVEGISDVIGGHESDSECVDDPNNCIEANLDVQYLIAVSQVTPTTYWYDESLDSFLSWIQAVAASDDPPLVHSISYGAIEPELPASIANAFNTEAMKLGAQGVTILVSSGDDGVANFQARSNPSKCGYAPSFPASSPYVTAVGATMGPESNKAEVACTSDNGGVITTGGGFSTIFKAPSYQTDAVNGYFKSLSKSQQPVSGYVEDGRAYPDVSMAGYNYEVVVGGKVYQVSGTSASAPVVAGMVSLVNANRLKSNKSALGFLNVAIYQYGTQFVNDITSGENNCCASRICCDEGFYASAGWDPLTGFGSVNYAKFASIFAGL